MKLPEIEERYDLGWMVTFKGNKNLPRHRWFFFKEGFSRDFVELALKLVGTPRRSLVLDPFLGVGTTCLTCRELGYDSVGVEISPLFAMVSRVKNYDYDVGELRAARDGLFSRRFERLELNVSGFIRRLFPKHALEDIILFKKGLGEIGDVRIREFFTLALMNAAVRVSYIFRDGAVVKIRKDIPRPPSLRKTFRRVVNAMIEDVERHRLSPSSATIIVGDARKMDFLEDETIDIVITSPPYLNKIEYTSVYRPEYELFMGGVEYNPLRSYIGLRPTDTVESLMGDMPPAAQYYFRDMDMALAEVYRGLKPGGRVVMVAGGGVFPDRVIDVDTQLAMIAAKHGFTVERIIAVNKRVATTRRVIKIGMSRESILIFRK